MSYFDALRFVNWLHNGQGDGDTETGAYTLLGGTPTPSNELVGRNPGAQIFLPTDAEWYKAAFYDTSDCTENACLPRWARCSNDTECCSGSCRGWWSRRCR